MRTLAIIGNVMGAGGGSEFTPLSLSNLVAHYAADDVTPSTPVNAWPDAGAGGLDLAIFGSEVGGTYDATGAPNSLPSVWFNGTTQGLQSALFTAIPHPYHTIGVYKFRTWASNGILFGLGTTGFVWIQMQTITPEFAAYAGVSTSRSADLAVDTYGIVEILFNGASSTIIVDGGTPVTGNTGSNTMGQITFAARQSGGNNSALEVGGMTICSDEITGDELTNIRNWYSNKYWSSDFPPP